LGLNFSGKLHTFNGGHEIPPSVIHEVKNFLQQTISPNRPSFL
jgi:predicted esterase